MSIIACYNVKGGVGKTTAAVNLAYLAAKSGKKTLLWDLDLQGAAGFFLSAGKPSAKSITLFTNGKSGIKENIQPTSYDNLNILPADFSLNKLERVLATEKSAKRKLNRTFERLLKRYDHLILDCPPGFSMLTLNIFKVATAIIAPVLPNPLSLENLEILRRRVKKDASKDLMLFPFFSMVDRRKSLHRETIALHTNGKRGFLDSIIPYASQVEQMTTEKAPVVAFSARSNAAKAYKSLWEEINSNIEMYNRVKKIKMW